MPIHKDVSGGDPGAIPEQRGILSLYNPGVFCGSYNHCMHASRAGHTALCKITFPKNPPTYYALHLPDGVRRDMEKNTQAGTQNDIWDINWFSFG